MYTYDRGEWGGVADAGMDSMDDGDRIWLNGWGWGNLMSDNYNIDGCFGVFEFEMLYSYKYVVMYVDECILVTDFPSLLMLIKEFQPLIGLKNAKKLLDMQKEQHDMLVNQHRLMMGE